MAAKGTHSPPPRTLTKDERKLWEKITRDIEPGVDNAPVKITTETFNRALTEGSRASPDSASLKDYRARTLPTQLRNSVSPSAMPVNRYTPPKLEAGDPRMDRHVRRGRKPIDAVIDLHGLTQIVAHERLKSFVTKARRDRAECILVITGKGGNPVERMKRSLTETPDPMGKSQRGILRSKFIEWVDESPLREQITRIAKAKQDDGGEGAFYVFLKKPVQ